MIRHHDFLKLNSGANGSVAESLTFPSTNAFLHSSGKTLKICLCILKITSKCYNWTCRNTLWAKCHQREDVTPSAAVSQAKNFNLLAFSGTKLGHLSSGETLKIAFGENSLHNFWICIWPKRPKYLSKLPNNL